MTELAKPSIRSASRTEQAEALSVARRGPGSLLRQGSRVLVEVRFRQGAAAAIDELHATGARIVHLSRRYQAVTVAVRPAGLQRLEDVPGVRSVVEVLAPLLHRAVGSGALSSAYNPCFGIETSEGDVQLRAAEARAKFEVDGSGIEVGVLSDSFDQDPFAPTGAAEDVASGDLPGTGNPCGHATPVEVLEDFSSAEASDEGRAMAQIVHDLAPGAALSFATAFTGETEFAANIEALAAAGARVIVDDVSYFEEPFFQEGPIGLAVDEVTAEDDVSYFSSAGNSNLIEAGEDVASWEAPTFRNAGSCPAGIPLFATSCMDFDPGSETDRSFEVTIAEDGELTIDLQWAQPWNGVTTDFDAYLLSSSNKLLATSEDLNVVNTQRPFEFLAWDNTTGSDQVVRIAINRCDLACDGKNGGDSGSPRLKFILLQGDVAAVQKALSPDIAGPTIFGHNGAEAAMSLGAVRYNTKAKPEEFSSRGPVTHYFGPADGTAPAAELASPNILSKPDVVATDGGANTFFGNCTGNVWRFFGTSAAAPHAAAVAALQREAVPAAEAAEVKEAQGKTAVPVGAFPPAAVGSGLVDAFAAIESLGALPTGGDPEEAPPPGPCLPPRPPVPPPPPVSPSGPIANVPEGPKSQLRTFFRSGPPRLVRTHQRRARVVFVLGASEGDVTFVCRIDGGLFRACPVRLVRRFKPGWHTVRASARAADGRADQSPAVYRFRVKRIG